MQHRHIILRLRDIYDRTERNQKHLILLTRKMVFPPHILITLNKAAYTSINVILIKTRITIWYLDTMKIPNK